MCSVLLVESQPELVADVIAHSSSLGTKRHPPPFTPPALELLGSVDEKLLSDPDDHPFRMRPPLVEVAFVDQSFAVEEKPPTQSNDHSFGVPPERIPGTLVEDNAVPWLDLGE